MWPANRRKELITLQNLLVDIADINNTSNAIEKIPQIIPVADRLLTSDLRKGLGQRILDYFSQERGRPGPGLSKTSVLLVIAPADGKAVR